MPLDVWVCTTWIWMLLGVYWLATALRSKPVARREKIGSRLFHLAIMAAAFVLLFSSSTRVWVLGARFVPQDERHAWVGFGFTVAGCAFAVWARGLLGGNWSATVTLKQGHELVCRGPYAIVRHPIYSGFLLGVFGTALTLGEVRGLAALALAFAGWYTKACAEEQFLVEQFGDAYAGYRRRVKQLIPFVF
jgi:protein-S-isoprenylcysteine O-methyltransferase Ste14